MLAFADEPRLDEMHITPRDAIDQCEVVAAYFLCFGLADVQLFCQLPHQFTARQRFAMTKQVEEGEQEVILRGDWS